MRALLFAAVLATVLVGRTVAATLEVANRALVVRFDAVTRSCSVVDRASGREFLTDLRVEGTVRRRGSSLVASGPDGATTLELRGEEPFLFVSATLRNPTGGELDRQRAMPVSFRLDLGRPATELRTLGSGGLTAPDRNPGSYLFLTCADPATRRGVVAGWVTQNRASGVWLSDVQDGRVRFSTRLDYGHLPIAPGQSVALEMFVVGLFDDARLGAERYAELIRRQYRIRLPRPTAVYMSWYADRHGEAGDERSTVELADFVARELAPFGLGVIQIDDGWQDGGLFNGPRRGFDRVRPDGPYPHGIAPVAGAVNRTGLTFGLWWLPFARNHQDPEYRDRQDWFARRDSGAPYDTAWGGTCLDLTHPEVREHLRDIARRHRSWGVRYSKIDGLWTGAACEQIYVNDGYREDHLGNQRPFHDPRVTNIEAYRDGLKLLRRGFGRDVFLSGCCVSQNMRELCALGLVDSMRIGPDYNADGKGARTGPLRGSRLWFLNGRVWWNDPDPPVLRASGNFMGIGPVSLEAARRDASWVALSGQFFLTSDWLPTLPPERLEILRRTMAHHDAVARPVDTFDRELPATWLVTATDSGARRDVIGVFNHELTPLRVEHPIAWLGMGPAKAHHAFDFWADRPLPDFGERFACEVPPDACRVIAVRAVADHPVLVSTSRHVTQGILEVTGETWAGDRLSGVSVVVGGDDYELRVAGVERWKLKDVTVSDADVRAGVTITTRSVEPGWLRVRIKSPVARAVTWQVGFEAN